MITEMYLACTYHDLDIKNLNMPHMIWGNFHALDDAINFVKSVRKKKIDTLFGAWDVFDETGEFPKGGWSLNKIVKHFPPRKDHDFFGKQVTDLKIATIEAIN